GGTCGRRPYLGCDGWRWRRRHRRRGCRRCRQCRGCRRRHRRYFRRRRPQREILETNARFLRPFAARVLCEEVPVALSTIRTLGALPVAVFRKLRQPGARLGCQLAIRVALEELAVGFDGVGALRGTPVLLLAA